MADRRAEGGEDRIRAVRVHVFGEDPQVDEIAAPEAPGPGELLVDVEVVGVGAWDVGVADGRLESLLPDDVRPFVMGAELCGRVRVVGEGVERFAVGDRVMANPGVVGAWAERVRLPVSACGPAPRSVDAAAAATVPVRALAAWQALERLGLPSGSTLLVIGAGGAVGRAAVEIAKGRGLRVLAIAGPESLDALEALGAEQAVDYHDDWRDRLSDAAPKGVEGALDLVGGESLEQGLRFVGERGRVVSTVKRESPIEIPPGVDFEFLKMKSTTEALEAIAHLVDEGGLTTRVAERFRLEDVPDALEAMRASERDASDPVIEF